ncbi:tyrosine-type recombinase/integrase [Microbispora sp. H10830]|uniref:tyrosine-type recombinase/integrase n=1 Tax=Microbispora sp. H10830 TaxID=2729109 RepID=UPI00160139FC|nr:tyrosine-type recombinase/integrase [Microbispora sp. H10830]
MLFPSASTHREATAGRRGGSSPSSRVPQPTAVPLPQLREHVERYSDKAADGWGFIGPRGARLRRSSFRRTWNKVRTAAGLPDLHFHDLRHVGNSRAAANGASLKELMARTGHSSTRAALIYLHATQDRDEANAKALGEAFETAAGTKIEN